MAKNSISTSSALDVAEAASVREQLLDSLRDSLRDILAQALDDIMNAEVAHLCGAGYNERSESRNNRRNGYRPRDLDTRVGTIDLSIPKLRTSSYLPSFIEPRRRIEKALYGVILEAYIHGVSTRSVDDLVQALGASGISKSEVSRICSEIDERVGEFLNRALEPSYPYVWLDATYVKARQNGRIVDRAVVVAIGLHEGGRREVLGLAVGHAETEEFWSRFLRSLLDRGLRGVKLVISDQHAGLRKAIGRCMGTSWQRCRVHFMRNLLSRVPQSQKGFVKALVDTAFQQGDAEAAAKQWDLVVSQLKGSNSGAASLLEEARDDVLAYMQHPNRLWSILASTNGLERLNAEIKRRANVVQIFPNDGAIVRLIGAVLMEQHDEWQISRQQVSQTAMGKLSTKDDAFLARGIGAGD
jgi:transposase-like protein